MAAKKRAVAPKKMKTPRASRRRTVPARRLLDRARLTHEVPNHVAGRADLRDADPTGCTLSGAAPRHFQVIAHLERGDPWLWIGIDPPPRQRGGSGRQCFAVITGPTLRQFIEDAAGTKTRGAR